MSVPSIAAFPHYADALPIATVDAASLTAKIFTREFIDNMRPCVVRGALRHWPAFEKWSSLDYFRSMGISAKIDLYRTPIKQHGRLALAVASPKPEEILFSDFLDELASDGPGHREYHTFLNEKSAVQRLNEDILGFHFIPEPRRKPLAYLGARMFMYRNSYTDWHFHKTDETLMSQVVGTKEVLLLPPHKAIHDTMLSVASDLGFLWEADPSRYPEYAKRRPYHAVVNAGDALYIPTYWWHTVQDRSNQFGVTIPWCWGTPPYLFDPRVAGFRQFFRENIVSRRKAPLLLRAVTSACVAGVTKGRFLKPPFQG